MKKKSLSQTSNYREKFLSLEMIMYEAVPWHREF